MTCRQGDIVPSMISYDVIMIVMATAAAVAAARWLYQPL